MAVNVANSSDVPFRADYSSFGVQTMISGAADWMPFGFAAGMHDPDTGLARFGARDYDPVTGRWTAKDPILFGGEDANILAYVRNDPISRIDLEGLAPKDKLLGLPKRFRRWYHRNAKKDGDADLTKEEAAEFHREWEDAGRPGPDNKGGWEDLFDWIIPFPFLLDPCSIMPEYCNAPKPELHLRNM